MKDSPLTRRLLSLLVALGLPLLMGGVGAWATSQSVKTWYPQLNKPALAPPNWVFGPVWTALYLLMGFAAWRIWQLGWDHAAVRTALRFFGLQLAFNLAWSLLFFGLRRPDLAFLEIVVLLALIAVTTIRFLALDRLAGWLLIPYLLWSSFAAGLNFQFWQLNR